MVLKAAIPVAKKAAAKKPVAKKAVAKKAVAKKATADNPAAKVPAVAKRTSKPKLKSAAAGGWSPGPGEVGIRVRMYRVGFGDFFLVTFLGPLGEPHHLIVDCGVFRGTSQTGDLDTIETAVADMVQTTNGRVELIVMTHRHADHIAGFARCVDTFKQLKVDRVWMPIWESEYEPTAMKFQAELTRTALGLRQHLAALGPEASDVQQTARRYMENATGELDLSGPSPISPVGNGLGVSGAGVVTMGVDGALRAGSNAVALDLLRHGFSGVTPDYYKGGDQPDLPAGLTGAGLACRILGPPPLEDLALMKLMDLQKNVGQYLSGPVAGRPGADSEDGMGSASFDPFGPEWRTDPTGAPPEGETNEMVYAPESFREWVLEPRKTWEPVSTAEMEAARGEMERVLQQSQPVAALVAAKQLNSFLNNQSLVVLFTYQRKNLLFVGDAQAGNWEHWLFDTDTPDSKGTGALGAAARQILSGLDFYKVGHHGSGNATPRVAAETMGTSGRKFVAMCSTEANVYGTEDPDDPTKGTEVPRTTLLDKLASESALIRSDQVPITVAGHSKKVGNASPLPAPLPGTRFETGPLWIDCFL